MGRLTSARNNCAGRVETHGATAAQVLTVGLIAFLLRRGNAVPLPPRGCCVTYGLTYDHVECCHEFSLVSSPTECTVEPGWVGGGRRFHAEKSCEEAQELATYDFPNPQPEPAPDNELGERISIAEDSADGPAASGCCVAFGLIGTAECCHQFTSSSAPEECVLPHGYVGGGRRFHSTTCETTQLLTQYNLVEAPAERPAGVSSDSMATDVPGGGYGYGNQDEDQQVPTSDVTSPVDIDTEDDTTTQHEADVLIVGGSQGLGPAWTRDSSIEPPAGEHDMGGWVAAVYTPEQQARLGVDENGADLPDDADHVTATLSNDEQQAMGAFQAAGFPGVLPVLIDPEPLQDGVGADGPCRSLPETSMAIVQWNPQCDDNGLFLPLQCDHSGNCWCVDSSGEALDLAAMKYFETQHLSQEACMAARAAALQASELTPPDDNDDTKGSSKPLPLTVTASTQTSFTPIEAFPTHEDMDDNQQGDGDLELPIAPAAESAPPTNASTSTDFPGFDEPVRPTTLTPPGVVSTPGTVGAPSSSAAPEAKLGLSQQRQLFSWVAGGAAGLVLFSALIMIGAKRCRKSSDLCASAYMGFSAQEAQARAGGEYRQATHRSTAPPNWSKSWVVGGIGIGDSLPAPIEPGAPPPGLDDVPADHHSTDRVSLVGVPRLPSTLQFSTDRR